MTSGVYGEQGARASASAGANAPAPEGLDPSQILRRIRARLPLLLKVGGAVFVFIALIIFTLTPRFTGSAQILVEAPPPVAANPLQPTQAQSADREKVASEIQVLMSPALVDKAIGALKLVSNPEFNPDLPNSSFWDRIGSAISGADAASIRGTIVQRFFERLKVFEIGTSRVITVEFSSRDPRLAQAGANAIALLYLQDQRRVNLDANTRSAEWLNKQIEALRPRVTESEGKVEAFRAKTGLVQGAGAQLESQRLTELNTQLTAAQAARSDAESKVASLERQMSGVDAPAVLQSPLIQQLRASEVQLKREITELSQQLLPTHPDMIKKQAELNDLEQQIRTEVQKVIGSLRNDAAAAAAREETIRQELDRMKGQNSVSSRDAITLRELEREAAANRTLLETFLSRYAEARARGDLSIQETGARIISRSPLPTSPSFPQKGPLLVLDAIISLCAGLFAVFLAEMTDRTVRSARDVERIGMPVLAVVPSTINPRDQTVRHPDSAYSDAILELQSGLGLGRSIAGQGKVVLVTSTERGEGRTTTAISLGRSMTQTGLRVLLIDADFNRPGASVFFGLRSTWGFTDLVAGRAHPRHVLVRDPVSRMHIIGVGHSGPAALMSKNFDTILARLRRNYDAILVDCAPMTEWGAAQVFMHAADHCVYAVRSNAIARERVAAGMRRLALSELQGDVAAIMTPSRKPAAA